MGVMNDYHIIRYGAETDIPARGRNNYVRQTGLDITVVGREILLLPVNSRGRISRGARLVIPLSEVNEVIDALDDLRKWAVRG